MARCRCCVYSSRRLHRPPPLLSSVLSLLLPPPRSALSLFPSPRSDPTRFHCMHVYIFTCTRVRYASNHALDSWLPCSQDSDNVCASRSTSTTRCRTRIFDKKKGLKKYLGERGNTVSFLSSLRFSFPVEKAAFSPPQPPLPINKFSSSSTRGILSIDSYARISLSLFSIPAIGRPFSFRIVSNCKEGPRWVVKAR